MLLLFRFPQEGALGGLGCISPHYGGGGVLVGTRGSRHVYAESQKAVPDNRSET